MDGLRVITSPSLEISQPSKDESSDEEPVLDERSPLFYNRPPSKSTERGERPIQDHDTIDSNYIEEPQTARRTRKLGSYKEFFAAAFADRGEGSKEPAPNNGLFPRVANRSYLSEQRQSSLTPTNKINRRTSNFEMEKAASMIGRRRNMTDSDSFEFYSRDTMNWLRHDMINDGNGQSNQNIATKVIGERQNIFTRQSGTDSNVQIRSEKHLLSCYNAQPEWNSAPADRALINDKTLSCHFAFKISARLRVVYLSLLCGVFAALILVQIHGFNSCRSLTAVIPIFLDFTLIAGLKWTEQQYRALKTRVAGLQVKRERRNSLTDSQAEFMADIVEQRLPKKWMGLLFFLTSLIKLGSIYALFYSSKIDTLDEQHRCIQVQVLIVYENVVLVIWLSELFIFLHSAKMTVAVLLGLTVLQETLVCGPHLVIIPRVLFFFSVRLFLFWGSLSSATEQVHTTNNNLYNLNQLHRERVEHGRLMTTLMPSTVAEQVLLSKTSPVYRRTVTVGFVYLKFYDDHNVKITDDELLISLLHDVITVLDQATGEFSPGIFKVEHVGESVVICGGLLQEDPDYDHRAFVLKIMIRFRSLIDSMTLDNGRVHCIMTAGVHTGPVVGTLIGKSRKFFRLFGDAVNTASRVCTTGVEGCIQASESTIQPETSAITGSFNLIERGKVAMKGKGEMAVWLVRSLIGESSEEFVRKKARRMHSSQETQYLNNSLVSMAYYQFLQHEETNANWVTLEFPDPENVSMATMAVEWVTHSVCPWLTHLKHRLQCQKTELDDGQSESFDFDRQSSVVFRKKLAKQFESKNTSEQNRQWKVSEDDQMSNEDTTVLRNAFREFISPETVLKMEQASEQNSQTLEQRVDSDIIKVFLHNYFTFFHLSMFVNLSMAGVLVLSIVEHTHHQSQHAESDHHSTVHDSQLGLSVTAWIMTVGFTVIALRILILSFSYQLHCLAFERQSSGDSGKLELRVSNIAPVNGFYNSMQRYILFHRNALASSESFKNFESKMIEKAGRLIRVLLVVGWMLILVFSLATFKLGFGHRARPLIISTVSAVIFCLPFKFIDACGYAVLMLLCEIVSCLAFEHSNAMAFIMTSVHLLCLFVYASINYSNEISWRKNLVFLSAIERSQKERRVMTQVLLPPIVANDYLKGTLLTNSLSNNLFQRSFEEATVFQSDIANFTRLTAQLNDPALTVSLLHTLYEMYDTFCEECGVTKIETIGDAYISVSFQGSSERILQFALNVCNYHRFHLQNYVVTSLLPGESGQVKSKPVDINVRAGVGRGKVVGCVLGESGLRFHLFGKALNRAIQLEGLCDDNRVLVCGQTMRNCKNRLLRFERHETEPDAYWVSDIVRDTLGKMGSFFLSNYQSVRWNDQIPSIKASMFRT